MGAEIVRIVGAGESLNLAGLHPERMDSLAEYLSANIKGKIDDAERSGDTIEVLDPEWCRAHSEEAGKLHADIIVTAYGPTYALPNKDPIANAKSIDDGSLGVYLMKTNGVLTGTACMVDTQDGRAELGRAASLGRARNAIIQDLRLLDWLVEADVAERFHTLFTTLRSAPDRKIFTGQDSSFIMRGGQAVTEHWKKFPALRVYGTAPLYLKAGELEQFTYAAVTRSAERVNLGMHVADSGHRNFVESWHDEYGVDAPQWLRQSGLAEEQSQGYAIHYPPLETGLTSFVHADIVRQDGEEKSVDDCVAEAEAVESPFIQVEVPVEHDTTQMQRDLTNNGFMLYGYKPSTDFEEASILMGRLRMGVSVVPTFWHAEKISHPFWNVKLGSMAAQIANSW